MTSLTEAWAAGTVALGMATWPPPGGLNSVPSMAATLAVAAAMAWADQNAGVVALSALVAAIAIAGAPRRWRPVAALTLAGAGALVAAVSGGLDPLVAVQPSGVVPWIAFGGGAALAAGGAEDTRAAAGRHRRRSTATPGLVLLVVPGLAVAVSSGTAVHSPLAVPAVAGALAVVAAATGRSAIGLVGLSLSAATAGFAPAAWLLSGAAAVAAGFGDLAWVSVLGLPGIVAAVAEVTASGRTTHGALALLAALGATALVVCLRSFSGPAADELRDWRLIGVGTIGVWLLIEPGSWRWARVTRLGPYDRGATTAVAVGLLTVVGTAAARRIRVVRAER